MENRNSKAESYMRKIALGNEAYNATCKIKEDPSNAEAYYDRGRAYGNLDKVKKAIADFTKAIGLKPRYSKAYYARAIGYFERKKYRECLNDVFILTALDGKVPCDLIKSLMEILKAKVA